MINIIVHVMNSEKFIPSYIEFINEKFDSNKHLFLVIGKSDYIKKLDAVNMIKIRKDIFSLFRLLIKLNEADKLILHSLFNKKIVGMLFLQPWLLKKSNWIIWGGDLYCYREKKDKFKDKFYEKIRKYVIKNISGIVTHIRGDYELAKLWYNTKAKYYYSFIYPSNLYKNYDIKYNKDINLPTYIQIGNSADPTNNHLEIISKLEKYKDDDIKVICPLSYGDVKYREEVIEFGNTIFGEKFIPLIEFMEFNKYLDVLSKIDIAIFNHNRQQAIGNITTLLGLGKKVYIRSDIVTWSFCKEHELKVYDILSENLDIYNNISDDDRKNNIDNVKKYFSVEKLIETQKNIFDGI